MWIPILLWASLEFQETMRRDLTEYDIFSSIPFAVSEDGALAICDRESGQLLFLDRDGQNPRRVGRQGQGPGEFQTPVAIEWIPSEKAFAVGDFGNRRLSFWDPSGTLVRETPFPGGTIFFFRFTQSGNLLFTRDPAGHFQGKPKLGLFDLDTKSETLLFAQPLDKPMAVTAADLEGSRIARLLVWDPRLVFGIGSDFVAVAWNESSQVHVVDFKGSAVGQPFNAELPRRAITPDDVKRQLEDFDPSHREAIKPNMVMRDYWPAMSAIVVDDTDRIWVFGFSGETDQAVDFRVFSKSGQSLDSGTLSHVPALIKNETLFVIEDEDESVNLVKIRFSS